MPELSLKVTILIPTYNRSRYLAEAVESALAQTYRNLEVVVSDNASTDDTASVVGRYTRDPRFRYYRNAENLGMVGNWQKALREYCSGEWFIILSDDDYFTDPTYIDKAVDLILSHPEMVLVYANAYLKDESTGVTTALKLPFKETEAGRDIFLSRGKTGQLDFALCTVIFNRELSLRLGAFSNLDCIAADSELFLKSALHGCVGFISGPAALYRFHGANLIANYKKDESLLLGYLDWCLSPFKMAREMNIFAPNELSGWRQRNIVGEFASVYKGILHYHLRHFFPLTRALRAQSGISIWEFALVNMRVIPELLVKAFRLLMSCISGLITSNSLPGKETAHGGKLQP